MLGEIVDLVWGIGTDVMLDEGIKLMARRRTMNTLTRVGVRIGAMTVSSAIAKAINDNIDDAIEQATQIRVKEKVRLQQLAKERA